MDFKPVYRALRQLSDWTLAYYSEIRVDGGENVPAVGPIIVVSNHHNEILDIATLSVTIPHGRPLCFWAKSTLFKNPIVRMIMSSSGSIPVHRNRPNNRQAGEGPAASGPQANRSHQTLFRETFRALDAGQVVGVFPEGTSYTEPRIAQVKEGAAWAALEYMRWQEEKGTKFQSATAKLCIVPVGIVHTNKSQYQSRVAVRWGAPIDITEYAEQHLSHADNDPRAAVKRLTRSIEQHMVELTVNAPDWDTSFAAQTARHILWGDEQGIPIQDYVSISQSVVDLFTHPKEAQALSKLTQSLLKYHAMLQYTSISHSSLIAVVAEGHRQQLPSGMTRKRAASKLLRQLVITLLHPRFFLFLPPFLLHIPAYALAMLGKRLLENPRQEESHAQYAAICGTVTSGAVYACLGSVIARMVISGAPSTKFKWIASVVGLDGIVIPSIIQQFVGWLFQPESKLKRGLCTFTAIYCTARILSSWHNALVESNYRQFKNLQTAWKVMLGVLTNSTLTPDELAMYTVPLKPPTSRFVKRRTAPPGYEEPSVSVMPSAANSGMNEALSCCHTKQQHSPKPPISKLIRPLLTACKEATSALAEYLEEALPIPSHPALSNQINIFLQRCPKHNKLAT